MMALNKNRPKPPMESRRSVLPCRAAFPMARPPGGCLTGSWRTKGLKSMRCRERVGWRDECSGARARNGKGRAASRRSGHFRISGRLSVAQPTGARYGERLSTFFWDSGALTIRREMCFSTCSSDLSRPICSILSTSSRFAMLFRRQSISMQLRPVEISSCSFQRPIWRLAKCACLAMGR